MANIRLIKRRIKSAKNIAQITKAMELVAASKMKRAQLQALSGKLYAQKIFETVLRLSARITSSAHPLLTRPEKPTGRRLVVLISTNKGLCGGLNTNLFRYLLATYPHMEHNDFLTVGKKGSSFVTNIGATLKADFSESASLITIVPALTEMITTQYLEGHADGVDLVFSEFLSVLKQAPRKKIILPLTLESMETHEAQKAVEFLIEPSVDEVFNALLPHYLENQIRDAILQAEASEHSARMVAMRNATDNAMGLMGELTLLYNKARQEKITYEISDMVTARLAVE